MTSGKTFPLTGMLGALALALTIALGGCTASSGQGGSSDATSGAAVIPGGLEPASDAVRTIAETGDVAGSDKLSSFPTSQSEVAGKLAVEDIVTSARGEAAIADDWHAIEASGIQMAVPETWAPATDELGWSWTNPDHTLVGNLYSISRLDVYSYDVEAMASAVPAALERDGFAKVTIIGRESQHSSKGTLCAARIIVSANYEGDNVILCAEYVLSESYVNVVEFRALSGAFALDIDTIAQATRSVRFLRGEDI